MVRKENNNKKKDPAYRPYDRKDIIKKKKSLQPKMNSFVWTVAEEIIYIDFLKNFKDLFANVE